MAIEGASRVQPTVVTIQEDASKVNKALDFGKLQEVPQSAPPGCFHVCRSINKFKGHIANRQIGNPDDEIKLLRALAGDIVNFHANCDAFEKECQEKLKQLSLCKPSTWKALLAETVDRFIIALFGIPLVAFGTHRAAVATVKEMCEEVDEKIQTVMQRELVALKNLHDVRAIEALEVIGTMQPKEQSHLQGIAECLLAEGAYAKAAELFKQCLPDNNVKLQYIAALKGAKEFDAAKIEIDALYAVLTDNDADVKVKADLQNHKIDCLVGLSKQSDARILLFASAKRTQEVQRKILFINTQELLAKQQGKKNDLPKLLEGCKQTFFRLTEPIKLIDEGNIFAASLDFWLDIFSTQNITPEKKAEMLKAVTHVVKDQAEEKIVERVKNVVSALKTEVQALDGRVNSDKFSRLQISEPIKQALIAAHKQSIQEQLFGSAAPFGAPGLLQRKDALREICQTLKVKDFDKELDGFDIALGTIRVQLLPAEPVKESA